MDSIAVKAFYDERWADFRYANRLKNIRAAAILEALSQTNTVKPAILDVGAGAGWLSNILSMFGPTTGLELSGQAVLAAKRRYPHVHFIEGDLREWHPAERFDIIVAQEVLEHFQDHQDFIQAADRLLKPGGFLILTTPNRATLMAMPPEQRETFQQQPVENPLTASELHDLASRTFDVLACKTVVPGFGQIPPLYRVFHSRRLWKVLDSVFGRGTGESLSCLLGLGLHVVMLARKPSE